MLESRAEQATATHECNAQSSLCHDRCSWPAEYLARMGVSMKEWRSRLERRTAGGSLGCGHVRLIRKERPERERESAEDRQSTSDVLPSIKERILR